MNRVLIIGQGAREHALAWKLRQSPHVDHVFVAPGNPGTATVGENVDISATDVAAITDFAVSQDIDLTVIGPESSLEVGLSDALKSAGRRVVGPSLNAFRLESSKRFAKQLMERCGVPTASSVCLEDIDEAIAYVKTAAFPLVLKADGLAAGKGVSICQTLSEAVTALREVMTDRRFGAAGTTVLIEQFLDGREVSLMCLVDGNQAIPLPVAQDHKRLLDGDRGPNTGGMGAYAPVPFLSDDEVDDLVRVTISPVINELAASGTPYRGVLFAGIMLTEAGPYVLEYNCRFGDPETQVVLPLVEDDLYDLLSQTADGTLPDCIHTNGSSASGAVLAADGYPDQVRGGAVVHGLDHVSNGALIFQAGTTLSPGGEVIASGGRVLTIVGLGDTLAGALEQAYDTPVNFTGMQRRHDIGAQALQWLEQHARSSPNGNGTHTSLSAWDVIEQDRETGYCRTPSYESVDHHSPRAGRAALVIMASGDGSNLQALMDACDSGCLDATITGVISHRRDAYALCRARQADIPHACIPLRDRHDPVARVRHEEAVYKTIRRFDPHLVVLAGWMLVMSPNLISAIARPIINVHPALLSVENDPLDIPILKGMHTVRDALRLGLSYTGVTVHYVTPEVDGGPVILREAVSIGAGDTQVLLHERLKQVEHRLLPAAVQRVLTAHDLESKVLAKC